jgi:uncharacterized protein YuzE
MDKPTNVELDLDDELAYIRYREGTSASTTDVLPDGVVAADFDESGRLLGIELLSLDAETVAAARDFAHKHGAAFPVDLRLVAA